MIQYQCSVDLKNKLKFHISAANRLPIGVGVEVGGNVFACAEFIYMHL